MKKFCGLIILDGYGLGPACCGNAISESGACYVSSLMAKYPSTTLEASGMSVGLPDGQMGNSEVGHLNIGAGRIVYQDLTRITKSIMDGDFYTNKVLVAAADKVKKTGGKLHVFCLLSDGGVHSHIDHVIALVDFAKRQNLDNVYVHCFMDGRDTPPQSGKSYVEQLEAAMAKLEFGKIASVSGRYYAMDRDNRWERVEKAYDVLTLGTPAKASATEIMQSSYDEGVTDEFVIPTAVAIDGKAVVVENGDSIIFANFRPDRAREITRSFMQADFDGFSRKTGALDLTYVCMTQYDATFATDFAGLDVAFKPETKKNTLGEYLSSVGISQLRIAETEKYAHVTFFFNGGVEAANPGEDRVIIKSPAVATYDLKPEMSAYEVTDKAIELIKTGKYDVMVLNYANCDMVGHTGKIDAAEKAVLAVNDCLKKLIGAIQEIGGYCFVTADHGNADKMIDTDGSPFTAHTTNPVPFILVDDTDKKLMDGGKLCDIAPTMLEYMGVAIPAEMTGKSLLK